MSLAPALYSNFEKTQSSFMKSQNYENKASFSTADSEFQSQVMMPILMLNQYIPKIG
jgi:hypothetical protein